MKPHALRLTAALLVCHAAATAVSAGESYDLDLSLEKAVVFPGDRRGQAGRHDLQLVLRHRDGTWQTTGWGYAPGCNESLHPARFRVVEHKRDSLHVVVNLGIIGRDTGVPGARVDWHYRPPTETYFKPVLRARWTVRLRRTKDGWAGTYTGRCRETEREGPVRAKRREAFPFGSGSSISPRVRPRLLFTASELKALRKISTTGAGREIVARIDEILQIQENGGFSYKGMRKGTGVEPYTEGHHIAAVSFMHHLGRRSDAIGQIKRLLPRAMRAPGEMGGWGAVNRILGVALMYDMISDKLDGEARKQVEQFLLDRSFARCGPVDSHYHAAFHAVALVCCEALRGKVDQPHLQRNRTHSEEALRRYLQFGLSNKGFGGEYAGQGEMIRDVLPALQAYRHATGRDLISGTGLEWVALQKRLVPHRRWTALIGWGPALLTSKPGHLQTLLGEIVSQPKRFSLPSMGIYRLMTMVRAERFRQQSKPLPLTLLDRSAAGLVHRSSWEPNASVVTIEGRANAATIPVTAMDMSIRAKGVNWIRWRPPDYGVFWLPRPARNKPNVPRLPGLFPASGAALMHAKFTPEGPSQLSLQLDRFVKAQPWVFKTTPCFSQHIVDANAVDARALRSVAVDTTGKSGVALVVVVADRIRAPEGSPAVLSWRLGKWVVPTGEPLVGRDRRWRIPRRSIDATLARALAAPEMNGTQKQPSIQALEGTALLVKHRIKKRRGRSVPTLEQRPTMQMQVFSDTRVYLAMEPSFHGRKVRGGRVLATTGKARADLVTVITVQTGPTPEVRFSRTDRMDTVTIEPGRSKTGSKRAIRIQHGRFFFAP